MLFSAFAPQFLTHQRTIERNSVGEMAQKTLCLTNHLVPFFGDTELDDVSTLSVKRYVASKIGQGLAVSTVNNHLTILRRFLRHAVECEEIPRDVPFKRIPVSRKPETNFLTPGEVKQLYKAASTAQKLHYWAMIILAVNTGLRIGELLALDWQDIDFARQKVTVRHSLCRVSKQIKAPKNGHVRVIDLNIAALAALRTYHKSLAHPAEGRLLPVHYAAAHKAIEGIAARAGLDKSIGWHTLRHTFATCLVEAGQPIYVVSKLLGHASVSMSERYTHLSNDRRRVAVAALDGAL